MKYDFDTVRERRGIDSVKWNFCEQTFGNKDVLFMSVADFDWPAPQAILDSIQERVEKGILGYTVPSEEFNQTIVSWIKRCYHWKTDPE